MEKPLVIKGVDRRSKMYDEIARVHKQIVEAKWRARSAGVQLQLKPVLLVHLEESIAFLAEELLKLQSGFEGEPVVDKVSGEDHAPM